jgi:hypothetical protein
MSSRLQRLARLEDALRLTTTVRADRRLIAIDQNELTEGETFELAAARLHPDIAQQRIVRVIRTSAPVPDSDEAEEQAAMARREKRRTARAAYAELSAVIPAPEIAPALDFVPVRAPRASTVVSPSKREPLSLQYDHFTRALGS